MARLAAYVTSSIVLATGVLTKAVSERANFYSACIYLSHSNACVIILVNILMILVGTSVFSLQRLLYGPLRPVEAEQLYDKAWFAITETCLAMTIFREEIGVWFIVLFMSLLVGKVWAWIGEGRVEILEQQPPANPRLFHTRLSSSLLLSLVFDVVLLNHSIATVRRQAKPNMMVMFAFEFAVLTTSSVSTGLRYLISLKEAAIVERRTRQRLEELRSTRRREREEAAENGDINRDFPEDELNESDIELPEWEDKSRWILYLELFTDLVRLILYLVFFIVLCVFYGTPLHIIRDVAIALRSFHKRLTDFVKYRHATRDMNERYTDASLEDIGRNDVCIICRETMRPWTGTQESDEQTSRPKKLPCGHILHFGCLRRWLQWQQSCPTCRQPVLATRDRQASQVPVPFQEGGVDIPIPQPGEARAPAHLPDHAPVQAPDRAPDRAPEQVPGQFPGPRQIADIPVHAHPQNRAGARYQAQQEEPRNGWRRFRFGPVTLDIGAWRGAQRAPPNPFTHPHEQEAHQIRQHPSNIQEQGEHAIIRNGALFGGIGSPATQLQIDQMEQQIVSSINNLRAVVDHLASIRASHEEELRLQTSELNGDTPTVHVFRTDSPSSRMQTDSEQTIQGLVLPAGWTIMPLNRLRTENLGFANRERGTEVLASENSANSRTGQPVSLDLHESSSQTNQRQSREPSHEHGSHQEDSEVQRNISSRTTSISVSGDASPTLPAQDLTSLQNTERYGDSENPSYSRTDE